jgi:dynein heavy chain
MRKAGGEGKQMAFLLSDAQITDESFLEDVNNMLNAGDVRTNKQHAHTPVADSWLTQVPNLYPMEELAAVLELVRPHALAAGKVRSSPVNPACFFSLSRRLMTGWDAQAQDGTTNSLYAYFVERIKKNLHVCLSMSPIGDAFRNRLRMYPSLINCCTIDWFQEWPEDALEVCS